MPIRQMLRPPQRQPMARLQSRKTLWLWKKRLRSGILQTKIDDFLHVRTTGSASGARTRLSRDHFGPVRTRDDGLVDFLGGNTATMTKLFVAIGIDPLIARLEQHFFEQQIGMRRARWQWPVRRIFAVLNLVFSNQRQKLGATQCFDLGFSGVVVGRLNLDQISAFEFCAEGWHSSILYENLDPFI